MLCIEVDDAEWATINWTIIDEQTSFSTNCSYGLSDINTLSELSISPNPFTKHINISLVQPSKCEIKIFDLLGKEMLSTSFNGLLKSISTSKWPKGTYLLKVKSDNGIRVKKIVKQ